MMREMLFISSFSYLGYNEKKKILDNLYQNGYYNKEELIKKFQIKKDLIEKNSFKDINNYEKLHNIKIVTMIDDELFFSSEENEDSETISSSVLISPKKNHNTGDE